MRPVAQIAQSVEQGIENPRVGGSIPSPATTKFTITPLAREKWAFFCQYPRYHPYFKLFPLGIVYDAHHLNTYFNADAE